MTRARILAVFVLLLSYGAVSARQPAVRTSVPLPAPAAALADALDLPAADRSRIMLDIIRLIYSKPIRQDAKAAEQLSGIASMFQAGPPGEAAPLPLDPSIWREAVLKRNVPDERLLGEILLDQRTALLYHGLAALDDETLGWLGPERRVIEHLLQHSGAFASYGRSLRIRGGRVVVPGGPDADDLWQRIVGAPPTKPVDFVRRLFSESDGRIAYVFDTIAHLDESRQRFALAAAHTGSTRTSYVRALARAMERSFGELSPAERPFTRHPIDPALILSTVLVTRDGNLIGPAERGFWNAVFAARANTVGFEAVTADALRRHHDRALVDAGWLIGRILGEGFMHLRSRFETLLFAQRVFPDIPASGSAEVATALRGMQAFPALMLTLERCGVTSPRLYADAAARAASLDAIGDTIRRTNAIRLFQASLGLIDRAVGAGGLSVDAAAPLIASLVAVDFAAPDGGNRFLTWLEGDLLRRLGAAEPDASAESAMLRALAGVNGDDGRAQIVEWEGRRYRVSPELAEFERLRQVRNRQRGPTLDEALATVRQDRTADAPRVLGDVLTSLLYAAYLGDPGSRILSSDNVALRHDLALSAASRARPNAAWQIAVEVHDRHTGWHLNGSLLALDVPLSRFALRRLDLTTMPLPPRLPENELHTASLTVAFMRPRGLTDDVRTEIAEAIARGRAKLASLTADSEQLDEVARAAGLSAWRRERLRWSLTNEPDKTENQLSLLELMWLGSPRPAAMASLHAWGAAVRPLTGCLCLAMPQPTPWEFYGGRPSVGLYAARGADVALRLAGDFTALDLPASLIPAALGYAMQDVLDATRPGYFDDWSEFGRVAREISRERVIDYVAALTAGGPLVLDVIDDRN